MFTKKTTYKINSYVIGLFFLLFILPSILQGQNLKKLKELKDFKEIKELLTFHPNKKAVEKDPTIYPSKFIIAPVISYSPETKLALGAGAKYLFKFNGSGKETRTSNMPLSVRYTFNNQFIFYSGFEVFTNQEKWVITGNVRFQNFPKLYYGLGRNSLKSDQEQFDFTQAVVEPIFLKQVVKHFFAGAGIRYNRVYKTSTEKNGLLQTTKPTGFNGFTSVGSELALLFDSRDNILNANNGWFAHFTHGFYRKGFGSSNKFELTKLDVRHYIALNKDKTDVLGFQFLGHFTNGNVPVLELAQFGSAEILRGYREGRYIDRHLMATQIEYRKHFKNTRWGFVAFAGTGDIVSKVSKFKLSNLRPNAGIGLRFMLDKEEKLNLRFDWGVGEKTNNVYLNLSEAF